MKPIAKYLPIALVLVSVVGCNSASKSDATDSVPKSTEGGSKAPSEPKVPTLADLPAELKHTAYTYYGLENDKPMDMEIVDTDQPGVLTGSQTTTLKRIENGKAVFEISRTGALQQLGGQELTLEKDGIYVTMSDIAKVNHDLELPTDMPEGRTWSTQMVVDQPGREVKISNTFKIAGTRTITTKVAKREAILITSTGQGSMQGKNVKMTSDNYYVKGVGGVKSVIRIEYPGGKVRTMTIQEIKPATGAN